MSASSRPSPERGVEPSAPRKPLARRFNTRYSLALGLLVVVAFVTALVTLGSNQPIGALNRQADRAAEQPVRVQRIARLAEEVALQYDTATDELLDQQRGELELEATTLVRTMDGLLDGDTDLGLPQATLTSQLRAVYLGEPDRVADTIRSYSTTALSISRLRRGSPSDSAAESQAGLLVIRATSIDLVADLQRAVRLYDEEIASEVGRQRTATIALLATTLLTALIAVVAIFRPLGRSIHLETSQLEDAERRQRESNEFQTFRNDLAAALDTTTDKAEVLAAVGRAFMDVIPDHRAELLLTDERQAHLRRAQVSPDRGAAGCPVDSPDECAALRRGQTMRYDSSRTLNVCPKLPEHEDAPCSAVCVPVTFNGRSSGVIHVTSPEGALPDERQIERLQVLATETGSRLGILESTALRDRQASTDGLTGLVNRRELERRAGELLVDQRPFAVAMADLDRFKELNDRHGHDSGDSALRLFAAVLKGDLRPGDIASRYGGEEFVVLLPDTDVAEAQVTIERLQRSLADQIRKANFLHFTASWGVTDSDCASTFRHIVGVADNLMYTAKRAGRNLMVIDREAADRAGITPDDDAIVEGADTLAVAATFDLDLADLDPSGEHRVPDRVIGAGDTTDAAVEPGTT